MSVLSLFLQSRTLYSYPFPTYSGVYYKFLFFSVALFAAPLTAYFFAKDRFLNGKSPYHSPPR